MKLGIFLQHYFPYGGLQRDAVRLARAANEAGHEATLVISTCEDEAPDDIDLLKLNSGGLSNHSKLKRFANDCLRLTQFDSTIAFSRVPGADFHFCGDPCFQEKFLRDKSSLARLLPRYRYFLKNEAALFGPDSNTHVFFLAESEIPPFKKHYTISEDRFTALPPWLAVPQKISGARSSVLENLKIEPDHTLWLFVGSDFHRKGLDKAIRAAAINEDVHLIVCGQDDFKPPQQLAKKLGIDSRVHLLGPRDDIPQFMSACDLLLHPARQETAGMVLIEALTYGLPVLCTKLCGYSTHVAKAGCPLLQNDPSPEEIAQLAEKNSRNQKALTQKIMAWSKEPDRFQTAQLILQQINDSLT